jgi:hypothetical protein
MKLRSGKTVFKFSKTKSMMELEEGDFIVYTKFKNKPWKKEEKYCCWGEFNQYTGNITFEFRSNINDSKSEFITDSFPLQYRFKCKIN